MGACDGLVKEVADLKAKLDALIASLPPDDAVKTPAVVATTAHLKQEIAMVEQERKIAAKALVECLATANDAPIAYLVNVDPNVHTIQRGAGETQSTVIAPGTAGAPKGRLVVTNDTVRPPVADAFNAAETGSVFYRDLDDLDGVEHVSTFDPPADGATYGMNTFYCSNDHDLVSLSNGDLLLVWALGSRSPLSPKPPWFDSAYRRHGNDFFGPGARGIVHVWRSKDGGNSFQFLSEVDLARMEDGSGALPQGSPLPFAGQATYYDMGGTDGPIARVDPLTDRVYVAVGCYGNYQDTSVTDHFALSGTRVDKTLVAMSSDGGETWTSIGFLDRNSWRAGIVALSDGSVAFWVSTQTDVSINIEKPNEMGTIVLANKWFPVQDEKGKNIPSGWADASFIFDPNLPGGNGFVWSWVWGPLVAARAGGTKTLYLAFPNTVTDKANLTSNGYRVFLYDIAAGTYQESSHPVLPTTRNTHNIVSHPTAIDLGHGPVLLYWYDMNFDDHTVGVYGRLIQGNDQVSEDFPVSRSMGQARRFNMIEAASGAFAYFYGDYFTADGYFQPAISHTEYHFYPTWVEPDGAVRFTHIVVTDPSGPGMEGGMIKFSSTVEQSTPPGHPPLGTAPRPAASTAEAALVTDRQPLASPGTGAPTATPGIA